MAAGVQVEARGCPKARDASWALGGDGDAGGSCQQACEQHTRCLAMAPAQSPALSLLGPWQGLLGSSRAEGMGTLGDALPDRRSPPPAGPTPPSSGSSTPSSPSSTSSARATSGSSSRSCWRCWRCSCWASSSTASPATWSRSSWGREGPAASPRRPSRACAFAPPLAWTFQTPWGASGAPVHPPGLGSREPHCTSSPPQVCCWRGPAPLVPACGWGVCPALLRHPPSSGPGSRGSHPKPPPGLPGKD